MQQLPKDVSYAGQINNKQSLKIKNKQLPSYNRLLPPFYEQLHKRSQQGGAYNSLMRISFTNVNAPCFQGMAYEQATKQNSRHSGVSYLQKSSIYSYNHGNIPNSSRDWRIFCVIVTILCCIQETRGISPKDLAYNYGVTGQPLPTASESPMYKIPCSCGLCHISSI